MNKSTVPVEVDPKRGVVGSGDSLVALPDSPVASDDLMKKIAMDIGKQVVAHIEHAYPAMFDAVSENAKLSVRNATYNAIVAAGEAFSQGLSEQRIAEHSEHRKVMRKFRNAARR